MWTRVYAFSFLGSLYLDQYLWIVYLLHLGYSPALIGVVYAVVQAGRLAFDVPSSLLADRLGSKALLAAGGAAKVVAALMFLLARQGFGFVLAGALATSLALTLPSGVDLAYVQGLQDRAAEDSGPPHRRFMNYVATQYLSALIGAALGGAIATRSFTWLYATETLGSVLMLAAALALPAAPARWRPDGGGGRPAPGLAAATQGRAARFLAPRPRDGRALGLFLRRHGLQPDPARLPAPSAVRHIVGVRGSGRPGVARNPLGGKGPGRGAGAHTALGCVGVATA